MPGDDVGFDIPPDVRLRAFVHGPRVGIGPRIVRTAPVISAADPSEAHLSAIWSRLAGGGSAASPVPRRRRRKGDEWASIQAYLDGLVSQHRVPVTRSLPPVPPPPMGISRRRVQFELCRNEVGGQPWWNLPVWWRGWQQAADRADAEVAQREAEPRDAAAAGQHAADLWWERLVANDPTVVMAHLDRAFGDHATPAAVVAVTGSRVRAVVSTLTVEKLVGTREPQATDEGGSRLGRLDKARRHAIYEEALRSTLLAVASESFALAPSITQVELAVVAPGFLGGPAVLLLAELSREIVLPDGAECAADVDLMEVVRAGEARLVRDKGGRLGALRPIDADDGPVAALLAAIDLA